MEKMGIKVSILPNYFLKLNGTFNKQEAIKLSGKIAGICYNKDGYSHLTNEPEERTFNRVNNTLNNGHHSVYDHIMINFNIQNLPKILAMVLNNENQYTTSEKSARYTQIVRKNNSLITYEEEKLYNKWIEIFKRKIKQEYGNIFSEGKIRTLAQENARYLVTVFMPTEMIYSTTLRQINYIASWMQKYIDNVDKNNEFDQKLAAAMEEFIKCLLNLNVLEEGLMKNEKSRSISLFGTELDKKQEFFGEVYSTIYDGSFAEYAQAQRHRTLDYELEILEDKKFFIPPIIFDEPTLVDEWLCDMQIVRNVNPQGELVRIHEMGTYDNFILKCYDRLCSGVQLEIMKQTRDTLLKYKEALEQANSPLLTDIEKYTHGARCTFPNFQCSRDCKFKHGKTLVRKI